MVVGPAREILASRLFPDLPASSFVVSGSGLIQNLYGMQNGEGMSDLCQVAGNLGHAADVSGNQTLSARGMDCLRLSLAQFSRDFRLLDIVGPGRTTAHVWVPNLDELEAFNGL